ncbi:MAG: rhomboid family intramembrane serine protease [Gammaproteobacteria bacterium]|nr:rhomboid family intramembrane serine protease [Gammaproteobacteria bacterium]
MHEHYSHRTVVFRSARRGACADRALVLQALGIPFEISTEAGTHSLVVDSADQATALEQLDLYERENRGWPPRFMPLVKQSSGSIGALVYCLVLLLFAYLSGHDTLSANWYLAGKVDVALIRDGEWWRTVTALTLHGDVAHLVGNMMFGAAFGLFAAQLLGNGLAWSSILIAGAAGNALNALFQAPSHTAVGASTAVFAALGLLSAYSWRTRHASTHHWAYRWGPIVGGIALLAYTGTGDENTDIFAHLTGFVSGALLGAVYGQLGERVILSAKGQALMGAGALAALAVTWGLAVTA